MTPPLLFKVLLFCALLSFMSAIAHACACGPKPTVLDDYENSDLVVIAHLQSIEKFKEPNMTIDYLENIRSVTMVVDKVFKGSVKVGEQLAFGQGNGIRCNWVFGAHLIGKEFLLYVSDDDGATEDGLPYINGCRRSEWLSQAQHDLLYLENINTARGRTRVSGVYEPNRTIRILGRNKSFVAKTDKDGVYETYDLPPGKYVLKPEIPFGWKLEEVRLSRELNRYEYEHGFKESIPFVLRAGKHFVADIDLDLSNEVSGAVYGSNLRPVQWVCVSLAEATDERRMCNALTDKRGRFKIDGVSAGTYLLVFNAQGADPQNHSLKPGHYFPALYYPGVPDREQAKVITITHGHSVKNLRIVAPK